MVECLGEMARSSRIGVWAGGERTANRRRVGQGRNLLVRRSKVGGRWLLGFGQGADGLQAEAGGVVLVGHAAHLACGLLDTEH